MVPPNPYCIEEVQQDVALEDSLVCSPPPVLFTCYLRPKNGRPRRVQLTKSALLSSVTTWSSSADFEELKLPISGPVETTGVTKWYKSSPTPCLYVSLAVCIAGRVPLIPFFLAGNSTPTIPHKYSKHKSSGFRVPMGRCDTAAADGRRGSDVYEVNAWLCQFGRGKPRLGGLSIEETADKK